MNSVLRTEVQLLVKESKSALHDPSSPEDAENSLKVLASLLPGSPAQQKSTQTQRHLVEKQQIFMDLHLTSVLDFLLQVLSVEWVEKLPRGQLGVLFDVFFLHGAHHEAFLTLSQALGTSRPGYKSSKCISLLEAFIVQGKLGEMLQELCGSALTEKQVTRRSKGHEQGQGDTIRTPRGPGPVLLQTWNEVITSLVTLPDRVANISKLETSPVFLPERFIPLVASEMMKVLREMHQRIKNGKDSSVEFLSHLLGKLCLVGYGELIWATWLPEITRLVDDFIWARIFERLVTGTPDRFMESTVTPLIKQASWYGTVCRILSGSVLANQKLCYLMTTKLLLHRHFDKSRVPQNVIGYLANEDSRRHLFHKVFRDALRVWGDASALKHTSYEHHHYITRAVLICTAFLSEKDAAKLRSELLGLLLPGVQSHLDSPIINVRRLGMVVSEQLTAKLDNTGNKLKFEYEVDQEVEHLLSLLQTPQKPKEEETKVRDNKEQTKEHKEEKNGRIDEKNQINPDTLDTREQESDLDSDDDLEPYDMSHDTKVMKVKPPVYLRECMEGLISQDNPDRIDACLLVAETLIRRHQHMATEVAVEFTKILLHLQDNIATPGFTALRHGAMVALTVTAPVQVADYLCQEFYERNYNLRQRMDILQVITAAAQELSRPQEKQQTQAVEPVTHPNQAKNQAQETQNWREIVQQRIDSKTRRFAKGPQGPAAILVKNKFAPVAGHFFFPLLRNFDQRAATLDLLGEDHIVLQRLVFSLGAIVYAALHAPIVRQMAYALLEFLWVIRAHPQQGVRQAVLFAFSMLVLAVPGHVLITDLQAQVMETKGWLEDVLEQDADTECKKLAVQGLVLLENSLKQAFNTLESSSS